MADLTAGGPATTPPGGWPLRPPPCLHRLEKIGQDRACLLRTRGLLIVNIQRPPLQDLGDINPSAHNIAEHIKAEKQCNFVGDIMQWMEMTTERMWQQRHGTDATAKREIIAEARKGKDDKRRKDKERRRLESSTEEESD